jgi:arginase
MQIHAVPQSLPDACLRLSQLAGDIAGVRPYVVPVSPATSREALIGNRTAQLAALEAPGGPVLTIGGDRGAEIVPIGVARYRYGEGLGVLWFDAQPMPEALLGRGDPEFAASPALRPESVGMTGDCVYVHVSLEALDSTETAAAIEAIPVPVIGAGITDDGTDDPTPVLAALINRLTAARTDPLSPQ